MRKISLAGFKDPVRRPRYIIWTGAVVLIFAAVMVAVLGVTSTRWFCSEGCHKVQDDTITAYEASSHSEVSCMACHMPVNANPVVFILHKAEALGELYLTVTDKFELPLNGHSHVALTMSSEQCTQCHNLGNREVTPSRGVKIDHEAHADVNAACPVCHNRVAHPEDFELALKDPNTGENHKHEVFMEMTACFRCHGLEEAAAAPGRCSACHPADFDLKPPSHDEKEFFPGGHAELAREYKAESEEAVAAMHEGSGHEEATPAEHEGEGEEPAEGAEHSLFGVEKAYASHGGGGTPVTKEEVPELIKAQSAEGEEHHESIGSYLPSVESVFYCSTCHKDSFCSNCHGMEMPHPASFKEPTATAEHDGHPDVAAKQAKKCVMCHGDNEKTKFCDSCHHGEKAGGWKFDKAVSWTGKQHPDAVAAGGVEACTDNCHDAKFCVSCHSGRKVYPASHRASNWTKPKAPGAMTVYGKEAAKLSAGHSTAAQKSMETCEVCHGSGGIDAKFCKGCHKLEMPHPAEFKKNHVSSRKNAAICSNCHLFTEVCSNCHHLGASRTRPWIKVHGGSSNKNGTAGCLESCHTKNDCVKCHTSRKVVPASHKSRTFVRDFSSKDARHVQLYDANGEICTYCHKGEVKTLPSSAFCKGCHKYTMPHAIDEGNNQKFLHKEGFEKKKLSKATCANCHKTTFCNSCHHKGSVASKAWVRYHPVVVKKSGAEACFECHTELYCSNCHVRRAQDIIR